jgi:hypothetical protein
MQSETGILWGNEQLRVLQEDDHSDGKRNIFERGV